MCANRVSFYCSLNFNFSFISAFVPFNVNPLHIEDSGDDEEENTEESKFKLSAYTAYHGGTRMFNHREKTINFI